METLTLNDNTANARLRRCELKLQELNAINERVASLENDIGNNVPHALFWHKIMIKRQKQAEKAYTAALRTTTYIPRRRYERAPAIFKTTPNININYVTLPENRADEMVENECAVCLEKELLKNTVLTQCNHQFCFTCFEQWSAKKWEGKRFMGPVNRFCGPVNCPSCRQFCQKVTLYK